MSLVLSPQKAEFGIEMITITRGLMTRVHSYRRIHLSTRARLLTVKFKL